MAQKILHIMSSMSVAYAPAMILVHPPAGIHPSLHPPPFQHQHTHPLTQQIGKKNEKLKSPFTAEGMTHFFCRSPNDTYVHMAGSRGILAG